MKKEKEERKKKKEKKKKKKNFNFFLLPLHFFSFFLFFPGPIMADFGIESSLGNTLDEPIKVTFVRRRTTPHYVSIRPPKP